MRAFRRDWCLPRTAHDRPELSRAALSRVNFLWKANPTGHAVDSRRNAERRLVPSGRSLCSLPAPWQ